MSVKLLTERHLEFLSLNGGYTCSPESVSKCHIDGNHVSRLISVYFFLFGLVVQEIRLKTFFFIYISDGYFIQQSRIVCVQF